LDFRNNYLFNTTILGLEEGGVDMVLIVGSNPRFEAPLLNSRIRKSYRNNLIDNIALIGEKDVDLLYDYDYLGDNVGVLSQILEGKHAVVEKLRAAKRPVVILGQQVLKQDTPSEVYNLTRRVCEKYGADLNVLHANASQVAAFDLGFRPSSERNVENNGEPSLLWLLGVDDPKLEVPDNCFVIYQGHNGDICANVADVVLPGAAYTEKQSTMVNMEGRVQQTMAAVTAPNMAREDWKIIRACSELANHTLPYDTLLGIRERMQQLAPHLVRYAAQSIESPSLRPPPADSKSSGSSKIVPKMKGLLDYYQTDAISRSSPTMAKCVSAIKKEYDKKGIKY
jgi:NADH dehydrogenase (ubiquinone) Fe-S protein 1